MTKKMKTNWKILALFFLAFCFLFTSYSFCQEMPKPGEVIDNTNFKKYAHLFPPEFAPFFTVGYKDLCDPVSITVKDTVVKSYPFPKPYQLLSAKNRGKYGLDKDGYITGGYNREGAPFPDLNTNDKDFAPKLMWNYNYKYFWDAVYSESSNFIKRRGEPVSYSSIHYLGIEFANRLYDAPHPSYKTPVGLLRATMFHYTEPPGFRNTLILSYRYLDEKRSDDVYLYIPTLRRVIRGESGQRSTPLQGSIQSLDDAKGFDGRIADFNYAFVGEKQVLISIDPKQSLYDLRAHRLTKIPFAEDGWVVRDTYVIDIIPKDNKYPQSKKRVYLDKEQLNCLYISAWDRANQLWKLWWCNTGSYKMPDGAMILEPTSGPGFDLQFGMGSYVIFDSKYTGTNLKYEDFTPSVLPRRGI